MSLHDQYVPVATRFLTNLSTILDKAAAHASAKNFDVSVLLNARLAPDMFPLTRQVQIASDMAKFGAARVTGTEPPKYDDVETTLDELKARLKKTVDFVNGIGADKYVGAETRKVVVPLRTGELTFSGADYIRDFVLPNLYFHVTTAYLILRHNGVELGKRDFLGA